jgi:hypothetical protein
LLTTEHSIYPTGISHYYLKHFGSKLFLFQLNCVLSWSQWPYGLRRGSAAASLLGLRVRIPPGYGHVSLVSVVCCHVEVSASGWSLVQTSPTDCGVSECDREASIMRRPWDTRAVAPWGGTVSRSPFRLSESWRQVRKLIVGFLCVFWLTRCANSACAV